MRVNIEVAPEAGKRLDVQTFGGTDPDVSPDGDYGIGIDELSISGIPEDSAVELAIALVNHLIANGRRFEIGLDPFDSLPALKECYLEPSKSSLCQTS